MCIYNTLGLTVYSHQIDPSIWLNDFQVFSISGLLESSPARAKPCQTQAPPIFFSDCLFLASPHRFWMNHDELWWFTCVKAENSCETYLPRNHYYRILQGLCSEVVIVYPDPTISQPSHPMINFRTWDLWDEDDYGWFISNTNIYIYIHIIISLPSLESKVYWVLRDISPVNCRLSGSLPYL